MHRRRGRRAYHPRRQEPGDGQASAGCGKPLKANFGDTGYYRVQYDSAALGALTKLYPTLAPADRVDLLTDEWALVEAGRVQASDYLDLTRRLTAESTLVVWSDVVAKLYAIDDLARRAPVRTAFRRYALAPSCGPHF